MSLFFEEFSVGQEFRSEKPRGVTAETIETFARLCGDENPIHLDEAFAAKSPFGKRIAHGLLGLSIASGLLNDLGIVRESVLAFGSLDWRFRAPVFIGDRLSFEAKVSRLRSMGAKGGAVVFDARLFTDEGRTVQEGVWTLLVRKRP